MNNSFRNKKRLTMNVSYKKLLDILEKKKLKKSDLIPLAGLNSNAISDISKNQMITINTLIKLCKFFLCQPSDILEFEYEKRETDPYYDRKMVRMLSKPNVIKIPSDDGKTVRYYLLQSDPITGKVSDEVKFMTELSSDTRLSSGLVYELDKHGSVCPANAERIVKEMEAAGFTDEYQKSDTAREWRENSNGPYNDM